MSVRIVTDSAAYLAPDLAKELGVGLVPFHIHVGGQTYLDGVDMDTAVAMWLSLMSIPSKSPNR